MLYFFKTDILAPGLKQMVIAGAGKKSLVSECTLMPVVFEWYPIQMFWTKNPAQIIRTIKATPLIKVKHFLTTTSLSILVEMLSIPLKVMNSTKPKKWSYLRTTC